MNLNQVMVEKNKVCGSGTMFLGGKLRAHPPRIPTGIFSVDYISGGGIPVHGSACFWGGDGAAKTYIAIHLMRMASLLCWKCMEYMPYCKCKKSLTMKSSWIDVEGTLQRDWIETIGVPKDSFYISLADYGEQAIDLAEASLAADDCGLVIIDSLGALSPLREMSGDTEDTNMGVGASLVTKAVKRLKQRMIRERKKNHPCAIVFVNQMRAILNKQFGDKEGQSGGYAMKHEFSLLFRCGKMSLDKTKKSHEKYIDVDREKKEMASRHSVIIRKEKVFTVARAAEFIIVKEAIPIFNLKAGQVDDLGVVVKLARDLDLIVQRKDKIYFMFNEEYKKLKDIAERLRADEFLFFELQKRIIELTVSVIKNK